MYPFILERPLHPYEEQRLRNCMQNSSRLQQLGLPCHEYRSMTTTFQDKNAKNQRNGEDSESEYDPLQDDSAEEGLIDDVSCKVLFLPSCQGH